MQRYRLKYLETEITLANAPEGWNDLKYTVSRDSVFHGFFRSFSGALRFVKDGKIFIDDIITAYGFEVEINIYIDELSTSRIWENKVSGILNFDPKIYKKNIIYTEVNFEDSIVHKKLKNRESLDVAYNRKESINETVLPGFVDESHTVQLRGQSIDVGNATAVFPFEAFNRLIQVICDLDYNPVESSVFNRSDLGAVEDGSYANVMLSKGLLMRGATLSGDAAVEGQTNLNLKLKECFDSYNKVFNLGLGSEYDSTNARWIFRIENKSYFYQTTVLFTLDSIADLEYSYESELMIQKISTGFSKFNEENDYGLDEYNNKSEFVTPISVSDTELNLISAYRADGVSFQTAIDNRYTGTEENKTDIDEDIFFIHAFDDSGTLRSVKNEDFDLIDGIFGADPIQANIFLSPARNMTRWGDYVRSSLAFFEDTGKVRFNKAENVSNLSSKYGAETNVIYENKDIDISELKTPRFSGRKANFNTPLTKAQLDIISDNPYGLVEFYDYDLKDYNYGWIREVSTDRVDKDTTWELWEVANFEDIQNNLVYMDEDDILLMDGSTTITTLA